MYSNMSVVFDPVYIIFLLLFQKELVLFGELNFIFLYPLFYLLMHWSFHILIIAVLFDLTAFLNSLIFFKFFKILTAHNWQKWKEYSSHVLAIKFIG